MACSLYLWPALPQSVSCVIASHGLAFLHLLLLHAFASSIDGVVVVASARIGDWCVDHDRQSSFPLCKQINKVKCVSKPQRKIIWKTENGRGKRVFVRGQKCRSSKGG